MSGLAWRHAASEVSERGLAVHRHATPEEREAVRAALGVLSCERIETRYRVRAVGAGCCRLRGSLEAELTQACVVSLEPVASVLAADLDVEFRPTAEGAGGEGELGDPFSEHEIEPIEAGMLEIGRIVFEEIASRLDPYPRAPGAALEQQAAPQQAAPEEEGPFAGLARLQRRERGKS